MRITILANRDLHSSVALNLIVPQLEGHQLTIFLSERVGRPLSNYEPPASLLELKFIEQELFTSILSPLIEVQPHRVGRYLTFDELGRRTGVPTRSLPDANSSDGYRVLAESSPHLILMIRYGCILGDAAIKIAPLGVLNLHSGLLPRYRGILCTLHALNAGETQIGCTLHKVTSPKIDVGPIVSTATVSVDSSRSLFWHVSQLYPVGAQMILGAINEVARTGDVSSIEAKEPGPLHRLPEDGHFRRLFERGFRIWDPSDLLPIFKKYIVAGGDDACLPE